MAFLKAREVKGILQARGFEQGTLHVLTILAEQQTELLSNQREIGQLIDQMMNAMGGVIAVADNMKSTIERLNHDAAHEEIGHSTQTLSDSDGN